MDTMSAFLMLNEQILRRCAFCLDLDLRFNPPAQFAIDTGVLVIPAVERCKDKWWKRYMTVFDQRKHHVLATQSGFTIS